MKRQGAVGHKQKNFMMNESVIWNKDRDSRDDENDTNYTNFR